MVGAARAAVEIEYFGGAEALIRISGRGADGN
jgi:hypothetical protein